VLIAYFQENAGRSPLPNCDFGERPGRPTALGIYLHGNPQNACVKLEVGQGGLLLMGGGADVDAAFRKRVFPRIKGGDVVVLRTSGKDGYNTYFGGLLQADSVETLMVRRRSHANSDYVNWVVRQAEFLWIAGGDQSDYLNRWKGTRLQESINFVYEKGGVIGGTSAGSVVQSEFIYDPDGVRGARSPEAVGDLCHRSSNISTGFLKTNLMRGVIADSHFEQRDRMGRLLAFMARLAPGAVGLGVDEQTSIFFTADGTGVVDGQNAVYVLKPDGRSRLARATCDEPIYYEKLLRHRLTAGHTYSMETHTSTVTPTRIGIDGSIKDYYLGAPYAPAAY